LTTCIKYIYIAGKCIAGYTNRNLEKFIFPVCTTLYVKGAEK